MSKRILYIGNKLIAHGATATTIDTLGVKLEHEGYELRYASSYKNKLLRLFDMLFATWRYRSWVDVVFIDTYSTTNFWYAVLVAWMCRVLHVAYIPILHGGNLPSRLKSHPKTLRSFLSNAQTVVSPSRYLIHEFKEHDYPYLTYIPNSVDHRDYSFKDRKTIEPKLLWVRSLAQLYHPEMAVRVLYELQKKYPYASLTMVGPDKDGSLQKCQSLCRELGVEVTFTGKLEKEDWIALSKEHDVFLNTTRFDNMPVSLIEAMLLGLPVVSTNVGGIPYLIDHKKTGYLVPSNDVIAATQAVIQLVEEPLFSHTLSLQAREYSLQYDWSRVKDLWCHILK